jgi:hypothetical protein
MSPQEAIGVAMIIAAAIAPVVIVGIVVYLKSRLEHKQIMAAIEKGTPLSELRPIRSYGISWIRNITVGIIVLSIALALLFAGPGSMGSLALFVAIVLFGVGIAWIVRGLLYRKYSAHGEQIQSPDSQR